MIWLKIINVLMGGMIGPLPEHGDESVQDHLPLGKVSAGALYQNVP